VPTREPSEPTALTIRVEQTLARECTPEELAEETGVDVADIMQAIQRGDLAQLLTQSDPLLDIHRDEWSQPEVTVERED